MSQALIYEPSSHLWTKLPFMSQALIYEPRSDFWAKLKFNHWAFLKISLIFLSEILLKSDFLYLVDIRKLWRPRFISYGLCQSLFSNFISFACTEHFLAIRNTFSQKISNKINSYDWLDLSTSYGHWNR